MRLEKRQIDVLNAELTLIIEKDDYLGEYNTQLKDYQKKSQLKGFRKGKTPLTVIKKMYGGAVMQEAVSKILNDELTKIITDDEFNIIGEPYLIDKENLPELDHKNPLDYTYKFELGLEPEFELVGVSESDSYDIYEVEVSKEMVDDEMMSLQRRLGEQEPTDETAGDGDVIYVSGRELYNGKILSQGYSTEFSFSYDSTSDTYKKQLSSMKQGDTIDVDIYQLEAKMEPSMVEKYLLKLPEDFDKSGMGKEFRLEITKIIRVTPAELNQETFDKSFGPGEVNTEAEARAKVEDHLKDYYKEESNKIFDRTLMETLMDTHQVDLPETFLQKWLNQDSDRPEMTEEEFDGFKKELKWRIIKKKLVEKFEVRVEEEEIFQYFVSAIRRYSPYMDEAALKNTVFSLMKNREQVNTAVETISSTKLFSSIRKVVKLNPKTTDKEKFYEIVNNLNKKTA